MTNKKRTSKKRVVVSSKTADQVFKDFKRAAQKVQRGIITGKPKCELSFDNDDDFNDFIQSIPKPMKKNIERYNTADKFGKALGLTDIDIRIIREKKKLIKTLHKIREEKGVSQSALARKISCDPKTIIRLEMGQVSEATLSLFHKMATALDHQLIFKVRKL